MNAILIAFLIQLTGFSAFAAQTFGTGEFKQAPVKLETLVKEYDKYKDQKVVVSAQVTEVCKKEGCWMQIVDQKTTVRAIMKDHGFKVPPELKDKVVLLEGKMIQKDLPINAVKHYMKDEGKSEAEINKVTAPQKLFQFVAEGVKLG